MRRLTIAAALLLVASGASAQGLCTADPVGLAVNPAAMIVQQPAAERAQTQFYVVGYFMEGATTEFQTSPQIPAASFAPVSGFADCYRMDNPPLLGAVPLLQTARTKVKAGNSVGVSAYSPASNPFVSGSVPAPPLGARVGS